MRQNILFKHSEYSSAGTADSEEEVMMQMQRELQKWRKSRPKTAKQLGLTLTFRGRMKKHKRFSRQENKRIKKIEVKLRGYIAHFMSVGYFSTEDLDWNRQTKDEIELLKYKWVKFCKSNECVELVPEFDHNINWIAVDMICKIQEQPTYPEHIVMGWIRKGKTPLEVVQKLSDKFKIERN